MIQKRLLNRFKDKNPSPLNNLDFLLSHTYGTIIDMANKTDLLKDSLAQASAHLSSALETVCLLTSLAGEQPISSEQYELLRQCINPVVDDGNLLSEMGWEEVAYASTAHLLRTCLAKNKQNAVVQTNVEPLETTDRLKKQVAACFDRVRNGYTIEF